MALALLYLVLALVVFVAATVVATLAMGRMQARRGGPRRGSVDAATVSLLRRRRQRLDRRLGIDQDADGGEPEAVEGDGEARAGDESAPAERPGGGAGAS